jgi:DNA-binding transcriptional regulator YiaG
VARCGGRRTLEIAPIKRIAYICPGMEHPRTTARRTDDDAILLRQIGAALYGYTRWHEALARDLAVGGRQLHAWTNGERRPPATVWFKLGGLMVHRRACLDQLIDALHTYAAPVAPTPQISAPEFRAALTALGVTQTALAQRLGLSLSTVNRWAHGRARVPTLVADYLTHLRRDASRCE